MLLEVQRHKPLKLIIDELTIKDPTVVVRPGQINIPGVKLPEEITVTIPTMAMKNIGTGPGAWERVRGSNSACRSRTVGAFTLIALICSVLRLWSDPCRTVTWKRRTTH